MCRSAKNAVFAILGAPNFVHLVNFISTSRSAKVHKNQNSKALDL